MKLRIDPTKCRGYGLCLEIAPDQFSEDDWGLAQSYGDPVAPEDVATGQRAIDACPYGAIRWADGDARVPRLRRRLADAGSAQDTP